MKIYLMKRNTKRSHLIEFRRNYSEVDDFGHQRYCDESRKMKSKLAFDRFSSFSANASIKSQVLIDRDVELWPLV